MDTSAFLAQRRAVPFDSVSLGYRELTLVPPGELDAAQVGYRVAPDGADLTGEADGDWRAEWLVVGHDELAGDPLFVDTRDPALPVYTAVHGEGAWEPELVSTSFQRFAAALGLLRGVAAGREDPTALEASPVPEAERERVVRAIAEQDPKAGIAYWEAWLEDA